MRCFTSSSFKKSFYALNIQSSVKKVKIGELIDTLVDPESSNEDIQHKSLEEIPGWAGGLPLLHESIFCLIIHHLCHLQIDNMQ